MTHSGLNRAASTASSITLCAAHPLSDLERGTRAPASLSARYPPAPHRHKPRAPTPPRRSFIRLFLRNFRTAWFIYALLLSVAFQLVVFELASLLSRAILGPSSPAGLAVRRAGMEASLTGWAILGPPSALLGGIAWAALDARNTYHSAPPYRGPYMRHYTYVGVCASLTLFAAQGVGALVNNVISARTNAGRSPADLAWDPPAPPISPEEIRYLFAAGAIAMAAMSPILVLSFAAAFFLPCARDFAVEE
ncbi:hypothetical protein VTO73DRAFT_9089 [Trametes versicolor]